MIGLFGDITEEEVRHEIQTIVELCMSGEGNIVDVLRHGWFQSGSHCFIDMELCETNLEEYIHHRETVYHEAPHLLTDPVFVGDDCEPSLHIWNSWVIANNIIRGISFIHARGYTHRDLKPANGKLVLSRRTINASAVFTSHENLESWRLWNHFGSDFETSCDNKILTRDAMLPSTRTSDRRP